MYRTMGRIHATGYQLLHPTRTDERGQGTIEYVGLVMLMAVVLGVVVSQGKGVTGEAKQIPATIVKELKEALSNISK